MDDWEKFNQTRLLEKKEFYSNLNMEDVTDAAYTHAKWDCKDFAIKTLGEYCDFYAQRDTFENFRNMCLKI